MKITIESSGQTLPTDEKVMTFFIVVDNKK